MYTAPTCLDPSTVQACREALAALSGLKRGRFPGSLAQRMAAIKRAAARVEGTFTPDEIAAASGHVTDPRELALAYADRYSSRNPAGAWRMRDWVAA